MNRPAIVLPASQARGGAGGWSNAESSFEPHVWQKVASGSLSAEPQLGQISSMCFGFSSMGTGLRITQATLSLNLQTRFLVFGFLVSGSNGRSRSKPEARNQNLEPGFEPETLNQKPETCTPTQALKRIPLTWFRRTRYHLI